ncbi:MAG: hypothetical protein U0Z44_19830 [Kouleothrix sp.]
MWSTRPPPAASAGLTQAEIAEVARRLAGTPHQLVLYHAMVGSQLEDIDGWMGRLARSAAAYARLRRQYRHCGRSISAAACTSAYVLDFAFDYAILAPADGDHGRYVPRTACRSPIWSAGRALHGCVALCSCSRTRSSRPRRPAATWYLVNAWWWRCPDALIVGDQQFIVLPLDRWAAPARRACGWASSHAIPTICFRGRRSRR